MGRASNRQAATAALPRTAADAPRTVAHGRRPVTIQAVVAADGRRPGVALTFRALESYVSRALGDNPLRGSSPERRRAQLAELIEVVQAGEFQRTAPDWAPDFPSSEIVSGYLVSGRHLLRLAASDLPDAEHLVIDCYYRPQLRTGEAFRALVTEQGHRVEQWSDQHPLDANILLFGDCARCLTELTLRATKRGERPSKEAAQPCIGA